MILTCTRVYLSTTPMYMNKHTLHIVYIPALMIEHLVDAFSDGDVSREEFSKDFISDYYGTTFLVQPCWELFLMTMLLRVWLLYYDINVL